MSRNNLLFIACLLAIFVGLLVSYFPPAQNAVSIWSLVSMAVGYGIRDLFVVDQAAPPTTPRAPDAAIPASTTLPPDPPSPAP